MICITLIHCSGIRMCFKHSKAAQRILLNKIKVKHYIFSPYIYNFNKTLSKSVVAPCVQRRRGGALPRFAPRRFFKWGV